MTSNWNTFLQRGAEKAVDTIHGAKIAKAIRSYDEAVVFRKQSQFRDWQQARTLAQSIKQYSLANLAELLQAFEKKISQNGAEVLWARDSAEAMSHFLRIASENQAKTVIKAKSMTTEEIDFNESATKAGIEVLESDLGEFIVQLAGEKPYHIVTPAMHKSKEDISRLFTEKLGIPPTDKAEDLAGAARVYLREKFCSADIGVTGANFLVADQGAVVLCENEGNIRLSLSCPPVHVVLVGIEKIIPRLDQLELFLPLLATSGTGQQLTSYCSIIRGPARGEEIDGPRKMYVILLDNGRTKLYADSRSRELLSCIRCGACLNACPVYRTIGGHSYGTTYQGPIGSAITPHLKIMRQWQHLSSASTLCGACSDVCPVRIELHKYLLDNRAQSDELGYSPLLWRWGFKVWAAVFSSRRILQGIRPLLGYGSQLAPFVLPRKLGRRMPELAPKSFAEIWKDGSL